MTLLSKLTTLSIPGDRPLLTPLRILLVVLLLPLSLYQLLLLAGLIGLGSKLRTIGLTISCGRFVVVIVCARNRDRRPTVRSRVPSIKMLPIYAPTIPIIWYGSNDLSLVAFAEKGGPSSGEGAGPCQISTPQISAAALETETLESRTNAE